MWSSSGLESCRAVVHRELGLGIEGSRRKTEEVVVFLSESWWGLHSVPVWERVPEVDQVELEDLVELVEDWVPVEVLTRVLAWGTVSVSIPVFP